MNDWFDSWEVIASGIGGDRPALRCPKANNQRPNKTPACFVEFDQPASIKELREAAARHKRTHGS